MIKHTVEGALTIPLTHTEWQPRGPFSQDDRVDVPSFVEAVPASGSHL